MTCPFCNSAIRLEPDARSVVNAMKYVARMAIDGRAHGVLVLVCDEADEFGLVVESGCVRRIPYAAAKAAERVAKRLVWR